jgi:hypothetical protein
VGDGQTKKFFVWEFSLMATGLAPMRGPMTLREALRRKRRTKRFSLSALIVGASDVPEARGLYSDIDGLFILGERDRWPSTIQIRNSGFVALHISFFIVSPCGATGGEEISRLLWLPGVRLRS